ncbi:isoleucine--tRNA ligase [Synechococcus sp. CS-1324]|uniref:isoleucine--tRNA ligase n=1 Tax=Synechococcus sp. CS-1324 TaxID=2847980 RepID=UPI000DB5E486|nr:isoleucine--tRNA ligase [Synechococcus sp. CS-1324]MCT0229856.1 isoleucine--tRNA ligase [Synechococcus sp. CS-1324]PZV05334.1 MAG: isoleucine--tRNA ligase [Cyanobium sp.]
MTASPASYKDTLNLLKTPFGMRANAKTREPELQAFWAEQRLYERLSSGNPGPVFTLHDGPPYANGALHVGHALNKILKDIINKYALLKGRRARFVPGWDCHGLPIELKVLQGMDSEERRALTPIALRRRAHAYALEQVEGQKAGFRRWGIWADWDAPYLTLQKGYEAAQIGVFGQMVLAGHIYRGLKPVHWSPSSRTALAEAELDYPDGHTSPSVYVTFAVTAVPAPLAQRLATVGLAPSSGGWADGQLAVAIWTTTPWTLPANLAVSVNGSLDYSICRASGPGGAATCGRHLVVAAELVDSLQTSLSLSLEPLLTVKGSELEGVTYRHPLLERSSPVLIGGDYITTEAGTGLVHTAPGHGVDDFNTGRAHGLPVLCPVDEGGTLTAEAGRFAGLNVLKDANPVIIAALEEAGALLKQESYAHRYPYDWRTKKPTIFRATEQWFASVEGFRAEAMAAIAAVDWLPASGRNRIEAMVRDRGDWCISRQRTWGLPIPVFYHRTTGEVLLDAASLDHIQALIAEHGSDVWWERDEAELLPPGRAGEADQWRKGSDTMDVWFDSGSSWAAVLKGLEPERAEGDLHYPADLYLEGSDQHRGWFQSSLLTSVAVNGRAPYRRVLTHGFTLDEKGRKMSKSLGNVVDPAVIVEGGRNEKQEPAFGADVLRLWVSSVDYSADVPLGPGIVRQLADVSRKVRNTARYLLGNLHDFDPGPVEAGGDALPVADLPLLDRWMLQRTADLIEEVSGDFERFEFYRFFQALQNFCVVDLSNFYLDIAKDRLYVSAAGSHRRRSCQTVMALVLERLAGLIAPVLCHMAEDIWQNLPYPVAERSVFERGWPLAGRDWKLSEAEQAAISSLQGLRSQVNRQLEACRNLKSDQAGIGSSLEAKLQLLLPPGEAAAGLRAALELLERSPCPEVDNLADWLLVSELQIGGAPLAEPLVNAELEGLTIRIARAGGEKCERCWHYETDVQDHALTSELTGRICGRCRAILAGG